MTIKKLNQAAQEIASYRDDIIAKLMQYAATDMLLFWGTDANLLEKQEKEWTPVLNWAREEFGEKYKTTKSLDVQKENLDSGKGLKSFMEKLSDKQLAAFYLAALNMRSVLLASALVKGKLNAEQAYKAAYLEELFQADAWGKDAEAEARRHERHQELSDIELFLKK
ncbi:MAG: hypothetical protein E7018_03240 [Alphaproteobacteria bacterium]|nr:hypothetical protein [Alphaproteobacteria bacterium]